MMLPHCSGLVLTNDISSPQNRQTTRGESSKDHLKKETFQLQCFTTRTAAIACKFESYEHKATMRKAPCLIECFQEIDIFFGKIACTVRMFRHGEMLLLPHARRIAHHRNRTRRGNSSFPFHFVFRIRHCVFSCRTHISSWSRTRDTTSIRGLNHG